jgi:hypothetical protein
MSVLVRCPDRCCVRCLACESPLLRAHLGIGHTIVEGAKFTEENIKVFFTARK